MSHREKHSARKGTGKHPSSASVWAGPPVLRAANRKGFVPKRLAVTCALHGGAAGSERWPRPHSMVSVSGPQTRALHPLSCLPLDMELGASAAALVL